ncbi:MAG: UDP-3-O-(3-hydroxymyristoyl)glucosamine N-acyltransferase [Candidatus Sericytochromatia bacterium]|nr:UDP-3-O-(3-hydroxymyristoyl)glucosamine N-acyltransferase [Candidatus Tanganyikabacteria bacterium]
MTRTGATASEPEAPLLPPRSGPLTLAELAAAALCEIVGDPAAQVTGVADPESAGPGDMVFVVEARYAERAARSRAGYVLAAEPIAGKPGLVARQPRVAMAKVLAAFAPPPPAGAVHPSASIDPAAEVAADVFVGAGCVVGAGARVGAGTVLHPRVVLYPGVRVGSACLLHSGVIVREGCTLGDRVVVQPGAVIGSDGFGFVPTAEGNVKIPQLGGVVVEADVEIGANCTIDRGTLGDTIVRRGTKLDNLVHLAHNVEIGEHCMLVAQVGISGSAKLGARCVFGGQSGAVGHIAIGPRVTVAAKSGVTKDTPADQLLSGFPARPHKEELRRLAEQGRVARRLLAIERRVTRLEGTAPPEADR